MLTMNHSFIHLLTLLALIFSKTLASKEDIDSKEIFEIFGPYPPSDIYLVSTTLLSTSVSTIKEGKYSLFISTIPTKTWYYQPTVNPCECHPHNKNSNTPTTPNQVVTTTTYSTIKAASHSLQVPSVALTSPSGTSVSPAIALVTPSVASIPSPIASTSSTLPPHSTTIAPAILPKSTFEYIVTTTDSHGSNIIVTKTVCPNCSTQPTAQQDQSKPSIPNVINNVPIKTTNRAVSETPSIEVPTTTLTTSPGVVKPTEGASNKADKSQSLKAKSTAYVTTNSAGIVVTKSIEVASNEIEKSRSLKAQSTAYATINSAGTNVATKAESHNINESHTLNAKTTTYVTTDSEGKTTTLISSLTEKPTSELVETTTTHATTDFAGKSTTVTSKLNKKSTSRRSIKETGITTKGEKTTGKSTSKVSTKPTLIPSEEQGSKTSASITTYEGSANKKRFNILSILIMFSTLLF